MSNIYVDFPLHETLKTALFCKHLANDITIVFIIRYTYLFNMYKKKKDNELSLNSQVEDLKERISMFPESESDLNVSQEDADVKYD